MPVFDQKKAGEDIMLWLSAIGGIAIIIFLGKAVFRNPAVLVAVTGTTPIIGLIWSKTKIALFDKYEMKEVTLATLAISFFISLGIGAQNGKVDTYLNKLFQNGRVVKYQKLVEAEERYEGRQTVPPHYETAYRFEPNDKDSWVGNFIDYALLFVTFGIPIINWFIFSSASSKVDKQKQAEAETLRKNRLIRSPQ